MKTGLLLEHGRLFQSLTGKVNEWYSSNRRPMFCTQDNSEITGGQTLQVSRKRWMCKVMSLSKAVSSGIDLLTFLMILWEVEVTYVGMCKLPTFIVWPLAIPEACAHNIGLQLPWKFIIIYCGHQNMVCIHCAGKRVYGMFTFIVCEHLIWIRSPL